MIELSTISAMLQEQLNDNECGIKFDIKADRNAYEKAFRNIQDFEIPGVLTAMSGNYEPLQGIKVYYMPVNLELWGFGCMINDTPKVPFTVEQQKECVQSAVENLNGTTQVIGDNVVIYSGTVVTVGDITYNGGGGYSRLPILVQMQLTVVEKAVLFNNQTIKIDGVEVEFIDFSIALARTGEALTRAGTTVAKTLCNQMSRVFSGSAYLIDNAVFNTLQNEILHGKQINQTHRLEYNGNNYNVVLLDATITGRMGAVVQISLSFAEVYDG